MLTKIRWFLLTCCKAHQELSLYLILQGQTLLLRDQKIFHDYAGGEVTNLVFLYLNKKVKKVESIINTFKTYN